MTPTEISGWKGHTVLWLCFKSVVSPEDRQRKKRQSILGPLVSGLRKKIIILLLLLWHDAWNTAPCFHNHPIFWGVTDFKKTSRGWVGSQVESEHKAERNVYTYIRLTMGTREKEIEEKLTFWKKKYNNPISDLYLPNSICLIFEFPELSVKSSLFPNFGQNIQISTRQASSQC